MGGKPRNLSSASLPALGLQGEGAMPAFSFCGYPAFGFRASRLCSKCPYHCATHLPGLRSTGFFPEYSCGNGTRFLQKSTTLFLPNAFRIKVPSTPRDIRTGVPNRTTCDRTSRAIPLPDGRRHILTHQILHQMLNSKAGHHGMVTSTV